MDRPAARRSRPPQFAHVGAPPAVVQAGKGNASVAEHDHKAAAAVPGG